MPQLYDRIGARYSSYRRPDPRIAAAIERALGEPAPVLNVGAGTGSYEPADRPVVAVEPAATMIRQRPRAGVPVVQASATDLPFPDAAFPAVLAVLTVHHWPDAASGLTEIARVARERVVILTCDPAARGFWLIEDYFPAIAELDSRALPTMEAFRRALGPIEVASVPIPHDCADGFLGAYWRRPRAYLDDGVRGAMSIFSKVADVDRGLARLRVDLADGTWERRHRGLLDRKELDLGYRLVVAKLRG